MMRRGKPGFTIVELLIVVVIIAILAAITIVAYGGLRQRANNTAIINVVSNSMRVIAAYTSAYGAYPYAGGGNVCVTTTTGCVRDTGVVDPVNATFDTNVAKIGTIPRSVASSGTLGYGIIYNYLSTRTFNGAAQPAMLFYWLEGTSMNCGISGVMDAWGTAVTATNGYTSANSAGIGKTLCYVSIPGPSA